MRGGRISMRRMCMGGPYGRAISKFRRGCATFDLEDRCGRCGGSRVRGCSGSGQTLPREPGAAVDQWRVRRGVRRAGERALSRAVPDESVDRLAVQRPVADPAGAGTGAQERVYVVGEPTGSGARPAELAGQPAAPALAEPGRVSGPDRVQDRPAHHYACVHHLAGAADRLHGSTDGVVRGDQRGQRGHPSCGPAADVACQHDLRLQRHLPGPDDQRRVRQAGPGAIREPPRREPARPGPAGLRLAGPVVPDPPAQRSHRARE